LHHPRSPFRLGDQLHVHERLTVPLLVALNQHIGLGIDAAHAGNVDEVAGTCAQVPGAGWCDRPCGDNVLTLFGETCCAEAELTVALMIPATAHASLLISFPLVTIILSALVTISFLSQK
jgi:hypothetical protein